MARTPFRALTIAAVALPLALVGAGQATAAVPGGNLVVNGGAEYGPGASIIDDDTPDPFGWTADNAGFRAVEYEEPGSANGILHTDEAPAGSGCRLFFSGLQTATATQVIDLAPFVADLPGAPLRLSAFLGGKAGESDEATVEFAVLDGGGGTISSYTLGALTATDRGTTGLSRESLDLPAGTLTGAARRLRVTVTQEAESFLGNSYNDAYVDNIVATLDGSDPAAVATPPGCQPAALTTGAATEVTPQSGRLTGFVDNRHEDVDFFFRYGPTSPVGFGFSTGSVLFPATDAPAGVSSVITNLDANTTYYAVLVSQKSGEEQRGDEISFRTPPPPGAAPVPTPTPQPPAARRPKFDTFKTAVRIKAPSCIKKGSKITVTVADTTEKTRKLERFIVQAGTGIGNARQNKGRTGVTRSTLKVTRFPTRAPRNTRGAKLILSVIADFGDAPGFGPNVDSDQSISGQKQIRFCKAAKKKKRKGR